MFLKLVVAGRAYGRQEDCASQSISTYGQLDDLIGAIGLLADVMEKAIKPGPRNRPDRWFWPKSRPFAAPFLLDHTIPRSIPLGPHARARRKQRQSKPQACEGKAGCEKRVAAPSTASMCAPSCDSRPQVGLDPLHEALARYLKSRAPLLGSLRRGCALRKTFLSDGRDPDSDRDGNGTRTCRGRAPDHGVRRGNNRVDSLPQPVPHSGTR